MTGDTLLCFFLSLQISSIPAAVNQFTGSAGEDFSGHCGSSFSGSRKIFCRENCEEGNVLIETTKNSAENGRYGIEYVKVHGPNIYSFYVKISGLTESDSGRYRCGLGESSVSYQDFTLSVSGYQSTSSVSTRSASTPTDSSNLNYSTESFTPSSSSVSTKENTATPDYVWLFVLPALAAIAALLSAMMMMVVFCRRRSKKPQTDSPVETNQSPAACETTRIDDDDVREEDGRWRSADVEIYLAYIDAISSSVTAAADQRQAPDDEDDEAEVDFSSRLLDSALRAGGGVSSDVLYSDIRHDELLYSNIF
ncbi:uncharacterized protein LOC106942174 isoform X2 [Poecilia latipinna]|uniref:uncharacterized protein LOC106942174 isoform X2 n=1 Tax=Poecilia latipinna TaxID=48699 RepID=UPI00072E557A|nr:PREDICTED: uncharacterized protein LOC106942174 isoform X2 [Poecilia latipinna]